MRNLLIRAGLVVSVCGCTAAAGPSPSAQREPSAADAEREIVQRMRAFVEGGAFTRERAEKVLGLRFQPPPPRESREHVLQLTHSDLPGVLPECPAGGFGDFRTAWVESASGDPLEVAVAYRRDGVLEGTPTDTALHRELGRTWTCSVGVQQIGPETWRQLAAYLWRQPDRVVEVRIDGGDRCAVLRATLYYPSWQPPLPLRDMKCPVRTGAASAQAVAR